MDFLRRHYEKVILALLLLGLLVFAWFLLSTLQKAHQVITETRLKTNVNPVEAASLKVLKEDEFTAMGIMDMDAAAWNSRLDKAGGALLDPPRYIRCRNPQCLFLLSFDETACSYCDQSTGVEGGSGPDTGVDLTKLDSDSDGMPDKYEKEYPFLNPNNPNDAEEDYDKDSFSNLAEYKAGTRPNLASEHPPLAQRLRYVKTTRRMLPLVLDKVSRSGEDKRKWDLQFSVVEGAPGAAGPESRAKTRFAVIGQQVGDFVVIDIVPKMQQRVDPRTKTQVDTDISEVVVQKGTEEPYTLTAKKQTAERAEKVEFVFLADPFTPKNCPRLGAVPGADLVLLTLSGQKETYTLKQVKESSAVVKLLGNPEAPDIEVPLFDARRDYKLRSTTRPAEGISLPGGPAEGPGALPPGGGMLMPPPGLMPPPRQ